MLENLHRRCREGVTNSSGTRPVSSDRPRKERTNPESAASRREFIALEPPAVGVLRTPLRGASRSLAMLEAQSAKLSKQVRFGPACPSFAG
jgi:hypothetical protein